MRPPATSTSVRKEISGAMRGKGERSAVHTFSKAGSREHVIADKHHVGKFVLGRHFSCPRIQQIRNMLCVLISVHILEHFAEAIENDDRVLIFIRRDCY